MAVGDRQKFIVGLVGKVLNCKADAKQRFEWLINKPLQEHFKERYDGIIHIFNRLGGDRNGIHDKKTVTLPPDAYFGNDWNFIFEFDELQHFTKYKRIALENYPPDLELGFDKNKYIRLCDKYFEIALKKGPPGYRRSKPDFPFENGRAAQRAFLDSFRDFLPTIHGLNPTIRISKFEVENIVDNNEESNMKLKKILIERLRIAKKPDLIMRLT